MGCGEFLVKYILFFTNLFFALAGAALIGVGVAIQLKVSQITDLLSATVLYEAAPVTTIVVGCIVFFIAFFGCCGAIRESNCMLVTYSIFMLLLMLAKIALATVVFVNLELLVQGVPQWTGNIFANAKEQFKVVETTFSCCGLVGWESYGEGVPASCCSQGAAVCTKDTANPGCNAVLQSFIQTFGNVIGIAAIVVAAIELVAVVFGLCLANHARNKYRRSRY